MASNIRMTLNEARKRFKDVPEVLEMIDLVERKAKEQNAGYYVELCGKAIHFRELDPKTYTCPRCQDIKLTEVPMTESMSIHRVTHRCPKCNFERTEEQALFGYSKTPNQPN